MLFGVCYTRVIVRNARKSIGNLIGVEWRVSSWCYTVSVAPVNPLPSTSIRLRLPFRVDSSSSPQS